MNKILCLFSNNTSVGLSLSECTMTRGKAVNTSAKVYPGAFVPLFECRSEALSNKGSISGMFTYEVEYKEGESEKSALVVLSIPFKAEDREGFFFLKTAPQVIGSDKFRCENVFTSSEGKYSEILLNFTNQEESYE